MVLGISLLFLSINLAAEKNKIYLLTLHYDKGAITTRGVIVRPGFAPDRKVQPETGYKVEVLYFDNKVLESFKFSIPLTLHTDRIDPETGEWAGEVIQLNETDFSLSINYFENGKTINIYDENDKKVLEIDVSSFANLTKFCGDGICQPHENYKTCRRDCPPGGKDRSCDAVEDGICDPDCSPGKDPDCAEESNFWILPLLVIAVVIVLGIVYYKKSKQREREEVERKREEFERWKELKEKNHGEG